MTNNLEVSIRRMRVADCDQVAELLKFMRPGDREDYLQGMQGLSDDMLEFARSRNLFHLVCENSENTVIGFGMGLDQSHTTGETNSEAFGLVGIVERLVVHPKYRECGVGSMILNRLLGHFNRRGFLAAQCTSYPESIDFYVSEGWEKLKQNHIYATAAKSVSGQTILGNFNTYHDTDSMLVKVLDRDRFSLSPPITKTMWDDFRKGYVI